MTQTHACPDARLLGQYLQGLVAEPDATNVDRHLERCPACVARLDPMLAELQTEAARSSRVPLHQVPPELLHRLKELSTSLLTGDTPAPAGAAGETGEHPLPTPEPETPLPAMIGRYRIEGRLGRGGMGTVYKAHDPELNRPVAIKVPHFDGPPEVQARARQRFLREARAAARVRHPHVCPIHDVGEWQAGDVSPPVPYVVMDFVEGCSLAERLKAQGRFEDCREAVRLVLQVAEALAAVHEQGIIHRDLKPGNILLATPSPLPLSPSEGERGRGEGVQAVLSDFGLARVESEAEPLTAEGMVVGTPAYMAPEQVDPARGAAGPASDLYSLGVVLYQMLTGRTPFQGSATQLLHQISHETPPPPSQFRPDLDPALEAIILQAMARRPSDRPASARHFADALRAWLDGRALPATTSYSGALPGPRRWLPRRRWLAAAGVLLLAAVGIGSYFLARSMWSDPPPEPQPQTAPAVAYRGWLDLFVWDPQNEARRRRKLTDFDALPLKTGDRVRLEAQVEPPAYLYLIWIDTEGQAAPLWPWFLGDWSDRLTEEPRSRLSLPERADVGATIPPGGTGMETIILLARATPLPEDVDLAALLAGLPPQRPLQHERAVVWFQDGAIVTHERDRAPSFFDSRARIDDPVLRLQRLLQEKLQPHATFSRAVSFARKGP